MTRRYEFSKPTRREALARAGDGEPGRARCEAVGEVYGLEPGQRCNVPLSHGVEFDHYPLPAGVKGSDAPDNCVACCPTCHKHKTRFYDVPMQAKDKRIRDRHQGVTKPKGWGKPNFAPRPARDIWEDLPEGERP